MYQQPPQQQYMGGQMNQPPPNMPQVAPSGMAPANSNDPNVMPLKLTAEDDKL